MMHEVAAKFLGTLGDIPADDLKLVRQSISAFLGVSASTPLTALASLPASEAADESELSVFLSAFVRTLAFLGLPCPPVPVLRRQKFFKDNEYKIHDVMKWGSGVRDRNARGALYGVGLRILHAYLVDGVPVRWDNKNKYLVRTKDLPVGAREMFIFLDYLPLCVENAYPGYAAAGLMGMIVEMYSNDGRDDSHVGEQRRDTSASRGRAHA